MKFNRCLKESGASEGRRIIVKGELQFEENTGITTIILKAGKDVLEEIKAKSAENLSILMYARCVSFLEKTGKSMKMPERQFLPGMTNFLRYFSKKYRKKTKARSSEINDFHFELLDQDNNGKYTVPLSKYKGHGMDPLPVDAQEEDEYSMLGKIGQYFKDSWKLSTGKKIPSIK